MAVQTNGRDRASEGRRRAETAPGNGILRRIVLPAAGSLVAALAWVYLVHAAVDFGSAARDRKGAAGWAMTVAAGLGAAACLLLALLLLARLRTAYAEARAIRAARGTTPRPGAHRR